MPDIDIEKSSTSRVKIFDFDKINFGEFPTDHMLLCHYASKMWKKPIIKPVQNLSLSPMALCFHYGQTVFEGFKAYRLEDGNINIFRLSKHLERINKSLQRMSMPQLPEEFFINSVCSLIELEQQWVSARPGHSLYIRPFMIATEARLGVKVSDEYFFMVICTPMSNYFGNSYLKVKVETQYTRAVQGGVGFAKNGGNYGAAFFPTELARQDGFDQVLWTDGKEHEFIEESGMMNIMFIIDDTVITPPLSGTILDGVTRDSILTLAKDAGMNIEERPISYKELQTAFEQGKEIEAFGVGTAAVIAPIELINIQGKNYYPLISQSARLYQFKEELQNIRSGRLADRHDWNHILRTNLK